MFYNNYCSYIGKYIIHFDLVMSYSIICTFYFNANHLIYACIGGGHEIVKILCEFKGLNMNSQEIVTFKYIDELLMQLLRATLLKLLNLSSNQTN